MPINLRDKPKVVAEASWLAWQSACYGIYWFQSRLHPYHVVSISTSVVIFYLRTISNTSNSLGIQFSFFVKFTQ